MFTRILIGLVTAGAALFGAAGIATGDPDPAPGPPAIMSYALVKPSEYTVLEGTTYAFSVNGDINCILSRTSGRYGCSGNIPSGPGNIVTGGQSGAPGFASSDAPIIRGVDVFKPLPAGSRIGFRNITCGYDGSATQCLNTSDQSGFVIGPAGSYTMGGTDLK